MMLMRRVALAFFFLSSSVVVCGCSKESSSKYSTDQIQARMHVDVYVDTGPTKARTKILVSLQDGFTDITLGDGDTLTAKTSKDPSIVLAKDSVNFYEAELPDADRGEDFTISFTRTNGTSAPNSTIKIPAPIVMTSPATASFAAGKVDLEWSNKTDGATVSFYTRTCGSASGSIGGTRPNGKDEGKFTLTMAEMGLNAPPPAAGTCISVDIERKVTNGVIDPAFKQDGSVFDGSRTDRFDVTVTP